MGAQIVNQCGKLGITYSQPLDIGDWKCKSPALKKRADVAHIGEWRDTRADPAKNFAFGERKAFSQLSQSRAPEKRRQKQTVGLKRMADLYQGARQIVDGLQRIKADGQIVLSLAGLE